MSKVIDLAKKLNALAKRGEGGERDNATAMLEKLMIECNISFEDIEGEKMNPYFVKVSKKQEIFFRQILASVRRDMWQSKIVNGEVLIKCNDAEFIEVKEKFRVLWSHFEKEEKIFYRAFVQTNEMYAVPTGSEDESPLTDDDRAMLAMMSGMKKKEVMKLIES